MSSQPYDPLDYLPVLFWTPEDKPFPFFDLPVWIQEKILRQYVPVLTKMYTLGQIPRFSKLLQSRFSWLSEEFVQWIPIFRSIQDGIYVLDNDLPDHGFYVSTSPLTFTLFCIGDRMSTYTFRSLWRFSHLTPLFNLITFLNMFLERYCTVAQKTVLAYPFYKDFIYVNPSASVAMWTSYEKKIKKLNHNECILMSLSEVPWNRPYGTVFKMEEDKSANLIDGKTIKTLQSTSLESSILNNDWDVYNQSRQYCPDSWKGGLIPLSRKVCKLEIVLKEHIVVHVSTADPSQCLEFINENCLNMLNALSENIMEGLFYYSLWFK